MKIKKLLYVILGCIGLALGAVGLYCRFFRRFRFCFWRRFALPKALKNCTVGLREQSCIKTIWKAM